MPLTMASKPEGHAAPWVYKSARFIASGPVFLNKMKQSGLVDSS